MEQLARALGVTPKAVCRWFPRSEGRPPAKRLSGLMLLKTCYFLFWRGYDIPFVKEVREPFLGFGTLITLGMVSPKEAARACGVTSVNDVCDLVLLSSSKHTSLFARILNERFRAGEVEERKQKFLEGRLNGVLPSKSPLATSGRGARTVTWKDGITSAFTQQVEATKVLAELLLSDSFTAEERRQLRLSSGKLYVLSDLFNALLSEQGRSALLVARAREGQCKNHQSVEKGVQ